MSDDKRNRMTTVTISAYGTPDHRNRSSNVDFELKRRAASAKASTPRAPMLHRSVSTSNIEGFSSNGNNDTVRPVFRQESVFPGSVRFRETTQSSGSAATALNNHEPEKTATHVATTISTPESISSGYKSAEIREQFQNRSSPGLLGIQQPPSGISFVGRSQPYQLHRPETVDLSRLPEKDRQLIYNFRSAVEGVHTKMNKLRQQIEDKEFEAKMATTVEDLKVLDSMVDMYGDPAVNEELRDRLSSRWIRRGGTRETSTMGGKYDESLMSQYDDSIETFSAQRRRCQRSAELEDLDLRTDRNGTTPSNSYYRHERQGSVNEPGMNKRIGRKKMSHREFSESDDEVILDHAERRRPRRVPHLTDRQRLYDYHFGNIVRGGIFSKTQTLPAVPSYLAAVNGTYPGIASRNYNDATSANAAFQANPNMVPLHNDITSLYPSHTVAEPMGIHDYHPFSNKPLLVAHSDSNSYYSTAGQQGSGPVPASLSSNTNGILFSNAARHAASSLEGPPQPATHHSDNVSLSGMHQQQELHDSSFQRMVEYQEPNLSKYEYFPASTVNSLPNAVLNIDVITDKSGALGFDPLNMQTQENLHPRFGFLMSLIEHPVSQLRSASGLSVDVPSSGTASFVTKSVPTKVRVATGLSSSTFLDHPVESNVKDASPKSKKSVDGYAAKQQSVEHGNARRAGGDTMNSSHGGITFGGVQLKGRLSRQLGQQFSLLLTELDAAKDLNISLQDQLVQSEQDMLALKQFCLNRDSRAANLHSSTHLAGMVQEIYEAQKQRDEAVLSRLALANKERDDALQKLKDIQQISDRSKTHAENGLRKKTVDVMLSQMVEADGADVVASCGEDLVDRLIQVKQYKQTVTAEEMSAILDERDFYASQLLQANREMLELRRFKSEIERNNDFSVSQQVQLSLAQTERDIAATRVNELTNELRILRADYNQLSDQVAGAKELRMSSGGGLDEMRVSTGIQGGGEHQAMWVIESELMNKNRQISDLNNEKLALQLQLEELRKERSAQEEEIRLLTADRQSLIDRLKRTQESLETELNESQRLQRLVVVLRRKIVGLKPITDDVMMTE